MDNIVSLRNHLFDALNRLADCHDDEALDREVNRASSIVQVSETIIRTAEVENQFLAITKGMGSGFIPAVLKTKAITNGEQKDDEETFDVDKNKNWLVEEGSSLNQESVNAGNHKMHKATRD